MIGRLMMLALATALLIATWSLDEDPGLRDLQRGGDGWSMTRSAAPADAIGLTSDAAEAPRGRVTLIAFAAADDDFRWLPRLSSTPIRRIPQRLDHSQFGCGRFQDGSAYLAGPRVSAPSTTRAVMPVEAVLMGLSVSAPAGSNWSAIAAAGLSAESVYNLVRKCGVREFPLPKGIAPGAYAVLKSSGGLRNVTITARHLREQGRWAGRSPAGYYVSSDAAGTWHFFRIEDRCPAAQDPRSELFASIGAASPMLGAIAGQCLLGPVADLPISPMLERAEVATAQAQLESLARKLSKRWWDDMAQEMRHALDRIQWSARFAQGKATGERL